jgi:hypothetical protein
MDVKNMAAMFGAKKPEPAPLRRGQTDGTKIAVAGVFSGGQNKTAGTIK